MIKKSIILLSIFFIVNYTNATQEQEALNAWYEEYISNLTAHEKARTAKVINKNYFEQFLPKLQSKQLPTSVEDLKQQTYLYALTAVVTNDKIYESLDSLMKVRDNLLADKFVKFDELLKKIEVLKKQSEEENINANKLEAEANWDSPNRSIRTINEYNGYVRITVNVTLKKLSELEKAKISLLNDIYDHIILIYINAYKLCKNEGELLSLL